MAIINWPVTLPQKFLLKSYSEEMPNNLVLDEYDIGPASRRARSTAAPFDVAGTMLMTGTQWTDLITFCDDTIGQRAIAFGFPKQHSSIVGEWLVYLSDPPKRSPVAADLYEVELHLQVVP